MRSRYRLLIIHEPGGSVRELTVPRITLWVAGLGLLSGITAAPLAFWTMAGERPASVCPQLHTVLLPQPEKLGSQVRPPPASPPTPAPRGPCPVNMILVEGDYCPKVFHRCLEYMDPEGSALHRVRCAAYKQPAHCLSPQRKRVRYCIDRDEYVAPGETLPQNGRTFAEARQTCSSVGKRLCTVSEWTFACEGEAMRPYPYGFTRDSSTCNADQDNLVAPDGKLRDQRARPGSFPRCSSSFGVRDLTGNLEEYVISDGTTDRSVRKGAYWQPGANHCRASQPQPEATYRSVEVGFRCCADAADAPKPS